MLRKVAHRAAVAEGTELVHLLLAAGLAHQILLEPTEALAVLRQAESEIDDPASEYDLYWAVKAEIAGALIDLGRPEEAQATLDITSNRVSVDLRDATPKTNGRIHHILGLSHQRRGASLPAIEHYQRALTLYRAGDVLLGMGQVHTNLAILATHEGRVDDAVNQLAAADATFTRLGHEVWMAITVLNRAWAIGCGGNLPLSLQLFSEAGELLHKLHMPDGLRIVSKAEVLIRAGLFAAAQTELEEAVRQFEEQDLGIERSQALILASQAAELAGDTESAVQLARTAIDAMDSQSRPGWAATARAAGFMIGCRSGEAPDDLVGTVDELVDVVRSAGHRRLVPMIQLSAAWAHIEQGRPNEARSMIEQARTGPESAESKAFLVLVLARLHELDHEIDRALEILDDGYRTLESDLRLLGGIDVAAMAAGAVVQIVATAKRLLADSPDSSAFLRWSDRSRSIATWRWPRLESPELTRLLNQARALTPGQGAEPDPEVLRQLEAIKSRVRELRWQQSGPAAVPGVGDPFAPTMSADASARQQSVLDLTLADDRWMVTVSKPTEADHDPMVTHQEANLDPTGLTAAIRLGRVFQTSPPSVQNRLLDQLDGALRPIDEVVAPHLPDDPDEPVLISIDEDLADLPWAAVPSLWHRSFSILPTQRHLSGRSERLSTRPGVSVLIGPGLATAGVEVSRDVADVDHTITGFNRSTANPLSFEEMADALDRRIVHIAAHGGPEPQNPLFNWLEFDFGRVFLHDLMFLDVVPEIVVLAACYAGQSQRFGVGGTASFANGFLGVGSRWVISACSAIVDDEALVRFASSVLQRIVSGVVPPTALALARRAVGPNEASPSALAFTCYGG